jgi:hypothetical protein
VRVFSFLEAFMAGEFRLANRCASAVAQAWVDDVDTDTDPGYFEVYTGTIPTDPNTAISDQVKLGTLTFSATCGTVSNGVVTLNAVTQDTSADATGTAAWVRVYDGAGATVGDYAASTADGEGPFKFNTLSIVAGGPIQCSGGTLNFRGYV